MYIKKVSLTGFGILRHHTLEFSRDKINIIVGDNETGKSTLCNAIVAIIYGLPSRESETRRSWDHSGEFRGAIEIDFGDASYKIERDFETNYLRISRSLVKGEESLFEGDANPKGRTEAPKAYRKLLDDLGFPPETIFRSAIYIAQLDLEMEIDDELRQHLSGAGKADYLEALSDLEKQYYSLTKQNLPGNSPKRIDKLLEDKISQRDKLAAQLQDSKNYTAELVNAQNNFEAFKQRHQQLANHKTEIENEKGALDEFVRFLEERASLDQRIKLVDEKTDREELLKRTIVDLGRQLTEKFALFNGLSSKSLSELESYVQSDAEETLREIQQIQEQEEILTAELGAPQFTGFSELPDDTASILRRLAEEKRNITELKTRLDEQVRRSTSKPPRWAIIILLLLMSIIGIALGATAIFLVKNNYAVAIALTLFLFGALSGLVAALLSVTQNSRTQRMKDKLVELRAQVEEKQRRNAELMGQIAPAVPDLDEKTIVFEALEYTWEQYLQKRRNLAGLIERRKVLSGREILNVRFNTEIQPVLELGPSKTIRERLREFQSIKSKLETNKESLQKIINPSEGSNTASGLQSRYRDIVILMDQLEKSNPSLKAYREDPKAGPFQLSKLKAESEKISAEIGQVDQSIRALEVRLGQFSVAEIVDPQLLEEEISDTQEAIDRLQERISALQIAIEVLLEAIKEYEGSHISRLSQLASASFSDFTRGGYKSLEIIPGKDPQIQTNENRVVLLSQLSVGAKDQLFFALRLAISEILSNEMSLPLILDDTFVNFDETRLEAVHSALNNMVASRQIILLSHDPGYNTWGNPPAVHSDK